MIVLLGLHEFYNLADHKGVNAQRLVAFVAGAGICYLMFHGEVQALSVLIVLAVLVILTSELFRSQESPFLNISATIAGLFYVAVPFGCLILIREMGRTSGFKSDFGGKLIILILLCIWICDSAAYIMGSRFGRHKLFARVSPNKTVEGTLFGFLFALLTAYLSQLFFFAELSRTNALVIGGICGSFGQVSDLVESLLKRDAGVKDSSGLIPGHGGILDRFDSEILVAPIVYFYLRIMVF